MTMLEVVQANDGAVQGITAGMLLITSHESPCFWFAKSPNPQARQELKISKKTHRACNWRNQNRSPLFKVVEFEPVDDPEAWQQADDALVAAHRAKVAARGATC
jgi:hypothetical protein